MQSEKVFFRFLTAQTHAIEKSVYLESIKAHRNLRYDLEGNPTQWFFIEWINKHAENFKNFWDKSLCKNCKNICNCNDCLKESCENFKQDLETIAS